MLVFLVAFGPDSDDAQSAQNLPLDGRTRDSAPESDRSEAAAVNRARDTSRAQVETRCSASAHGLARRSNRYSAMTPLPIVRGPRCTSKRRSLLGGHAGRCSSTLLGGTPARVRVRRATRQRCGRAHRRRRVEIPLPPMGVGSRAAFVAQFLGAQSRPQRRCAAGLIVSPNVKSGHAWIKPGLPRGIDTECPLSCVPVAALAGVRPALARSVRPAPRLRLR
jgi:hypothetical protein